MRFQITDKIRLKGTPKQWELQRKRKGGASDDKKRPEWYPFQYYSSFHSALRACAEYDFRVAEDVADLTGRIARLEAVAQQSIELVNDAVQGLG
jgi:hypothetical protein